MSMRTILSIVIALALVVSISGCTNSGSTREVKTSATDGIVINSFTVDPARINDDETALFSLEFENVGGTTATNVRADLFGAESFQTHPNEVVVSQLSPPNINIDPNTPGDFYMADWELSAPDLPEGIVSPFNIEARVRYHYHTTNVITIPVYEKQEFIRRTQIDAAIDTANIVNVNAPVKVDISPADHLVFDSANPDQSYGERLVFTNAGSGAPIGRIDNEDVDGVITGTITLAGPADFVNCIDATSGKHVNIAPGDVKIRRSESVTKPCSITINEDEFGSSPTATITMTMDLDYDYYVTSTVTLEVAGKR